MIQTKYIGSNSNVIFNRCTSTVNSFVSYTRIYIYMLYIGMLVNQHNNINLYRIIQILFYFVRTLSLPTNNL